MLTVPCVQVQDWARQQFAQEVQSSPADKLNLGKTCLLIALEDEAAAASSKRNWSLEWRKTSAGLFATLLQPDHASPGSRSAHVHSMHTQQSHLHASINVSFSAPGTCQSHRVQPCMAAAASLPALPACMRMRTLCIIHKAQPRVLTTDSARQLAWRRLHLEPQQAGCSGSRGSCRVQGHL